MKLTVIFLFLPLSLSVFGASEGHEVSVLDLKFPALNFLILFGFLFFKLRKPLANLFVKYSKDVEELFNHAEKKDKEAQIKLDMYKTKLDQVGNVTKKISEDAKKDVKAYVRKLEKENIEKLERLESDSRDKVLYEKNMMVEEVERELLEQVVALAKNKIGSDKAAQAKATNMLLGKL